MEALLTRRSIRKYKPLEIPDNLVKQILQSAMNAPSAGNQQPWEFIIVTKREILDTIMKAHPYSEMLAEAPMALVVCGNEQKEEHKGYWVQDCSAATQNILIAARALGLGSCWLGVYPRQERLNPIKTILGLPAHVLPLCVIALGYPDEEKPTPDRYDTEKIHYDKWE